MKKILLYTLLFPLFAAFNACSEGTDIDNSPYPDGMGGLRLKNNTSTDITIPVITKSADFTDIHAEDFYVGILDKDGASVKDFESFTAMLDSGLPLILPHGEYKAIASSYKLGETRVSADPYFVDERTFIIEEKKTTNVDLKCTFQSLGVELVVSNQFKELLEKLPNDYSYEVTVSNGIENWEFTPNKMEPGYFVDPCDELVVKIRVRLGSSNDWYPERTYRVKNIQNNPATSPVLGEYYIIRLDAGEQEEKLTLKTFALTDKVKE